MNNKGFTLIELLAVIMVLSIIITISVSAYTSIQNSINDQQYENVISYIKTNAVKYAKENKFRPKDNEYIYINVDGLIKRGYIEADDDAGNLKNPKSDEMLNDACIKIIYNRDNQTYEANVLDNNTICNNHLNNFPYVGP